MDEDLDAIRAKRLMELQQQQGGNGMANAEKMAEAKQQQEAMKNNILSQVLTQGARARLNTIALAKPEKGQIVENIIVRMAQTGQIRSKLGEEELIGLLEQVNKQISTDKPSVKFDRRRAALDSDDDD